MMKKNVYLLMLATLMGITSSCNSEDSATDLPLIDESEEERNYTDSMLAVSVINDMYDVQESNVYKFKQGRNISTAEPNKYYYACKDAKEAALFYNTYCTDSPQKVTFETVGDSLVEKIDVSDRKSTFGKYGYTSLAIGDGSPEYATIEFSFKAVGDTHQLIFVPESFMPDNGDDKPFMSAYTLGDICLDEQNNQWICVKDATLAQKDNGEKDYGYLVRLVKGDNKYWDRTSVSDHFKTVWYAVAKPGYTIAGRAAWSGFCSMMRHSQGTNALSEMNKNKKAFRDETTKLMETLAGKNNDRRIFQVGAVNPGEKSYHWKCARYIWKFKNLTYIVVSKKEYSIITIAPWHSLPDGDLGTYSLSGGCEMLEKAFFTEKIHGMRKIFPEY